MNNSTSDDTAPSPKEPSSQHLPDLLLLNLQRIDAAVEGEYAENDRRLNWFLLFQAFLFQGYATALQAITGASDGHERQFAHAIVLMIIIIAVGLITSWVTHVSTQAGITVAAHCAWTFLLLLIVARTVAIKQLAPRANDAQPVAQEDA